MTKKEADKFDRLEKRIDEGLERLRKDIKFEVQAFLTIGFASGVVFVSASILLFKFFLR